MRKLAILGALFLILAMSLTGISLDRVESSSTKFDDFEWGSVGDNLSSSTKASWRVHKPEYWPGQPLVLEGTISTEYFYSGSRSAKLSGDSAFSQSTLLLNSSTKYVLSFRIYKEDSTSSLFLRHGNGSKVIVVQVNSTEDIRYVATSVWPSYTVNDTGYNISADQWELIELSNIDFKSGTFDIGLNGSLVKSGATMVVGSEDYNSALAITNNDAVSGTGHNLWIDDVKAVPIAPDVYGPANVLPYAFLGIALLAIIGAGIEGLSLVGIIVLAISVVVSIVGTSVILDALNAW